MPYPVFGQMDKEDIYSVIAYMRTLKPVVYDPPASKPKFPASMLMKTIPQPKKFKQKPDPSNTVEYGKYLVEMASCTDCHTPMVEGKPVDGKYLSGGIEFNLPGNTVVRSHNLTPDETGLGTWTKEQFIKRFKQTLAPEYWNTPYTPGQFQTAMPWTVYAGMTEQDLGAIYDYLRTIPTVKNQVEKFGVKLY